MKNVIIFRRNIDREKLIHLLIITNNMIHRYIIQLLYDAFNLLYIFLTVFFPSQFSICVNTILMVKTLCFIDYIDSGYGLLFVNG